MSDQTLQTVLPVFAKEPIPRTFIKSRSRVPKLQISILVSSLVVAIVLIFAVAPGLVAPYGPADMDYDAILAAPSLHHILGTDQYGSDVFSTIIFGARQSVLMALGAILLGASSGTFIGLVSGYSGGKIDALLMRLVDVWMSVPPMLLALIVAAALGGGFSSTIIAIASMIVPRFSRVIRAQVITIKSRPFIAAAQALGASRLWILRRHVLPHIVSLVLVMATLATGEAIIMGSSLSFIGLGVSADHPDWGYLLSQGRNYLTDAWWYATFPGLAITALVISVNLLGDGLRFYLDSKRT